MTCKGRRRSNRRQGYIHRHQSFGTDGPSQETDGQQYIVQADGVARKSLGACELISPSVGCSHCIQRGVLPLSSLMRQKRSVSIPWCLPLSNHCWSVGSTANARGVLQVQALKGFRDPSNAQMRGVPSILALIQQLVDLRLTMLTFPILFKCVATIIK